jgi:hypothetical protein
MDYSRLLLKFRTEILGLMVAVVFIASGLIWPTFIPDQLSGQDSTWFKTLISALFIGMGVLSFFWLVIIHRFISHKSKKDYMY